jgi:hypothetical protein
MKTDGRNPADDIGSNFSRGFFCCELLEVPVVSIVPVSNRCNLYASHCVKKQVFWYVLLLRSIHAYDTYIDTD